MAKYNIDLVDYRAFKETLPADVRQETFTYFSVSYDVTLMLYLIKKENCKLVKLGVVDWSNAMDMDHPKDETGEAIDAIHGISDKEVFEDNINPDIPIILISHEWEKGKKKGSEPLIIDGHKRLRRAFLEGRKVIQAYQVPAKIAKLARIF